MDAEIKPWEGTLVRTWLERRVATARADQAAAQRSGRGSEDDCDKASAEELVCTELRGRESVETQKGFVEDLKRLLDREDHVWRGIYDEGRFDRHVRTYVRKLLKMAKANAGFEKTSRYQ